MTGKLSLKQDAFVKAYLLNGGNATKAAISAGYSEKTAKFIGSENLSKPNILKAIEAHQKMTKEAFIMTKLEKLKALEKIIAESMREHEEKGILNATAAIAAIKTHNEMQGDNAPTKATSEIKVFQSLGERLTNGSKR
ncbi:MAG: terminase small subunit [Pseudoalteromonas sp.]|uniref:terminase small subunit n=1 Tax=Pseudoalteromonas sp. TaxID=53249 RepID=UPI003F960808